MRRTESVMPYCRVLVAPRERSANDGPESMTLATDGQVAWTHGEIPGWLEVEALVMARTCCPARGMASQLSRCFGAVGIDPTDFHFASPPGGHSQRRATSMRRPEERAFHRASAQAGRRAPRGAPSWRTHWPPRRAWPQLCAAGANPVRCARSQNALTGGLHPTGDRAARVSSVPVRSELVGCRAHRGRADGPCRPRSRR